MVSHTEGRLQTENIQEQGAMINSRRDKLRGQWRKLHNEELHDLHCSSNNMMMKWRRVKCLEDVACMWEIKNILFWSEDLKERDCLEELGIIGKLILQWISKNVIEGCGVDSPDSRNRLMSYCTKCDLKFHKMQEILLAEKY